jgi:fucose permease
MVQLSYTHTRIAAYAGYVMQAIVNNLPPLLFVTFWRQFDISLDKLAALIVINFITQLAVDLLSVRFMDKIGYRRAAIAAHICGAVGLFSLGVLPFVIPSAYAGILIAMLINAVGGGIAEVIISPIVEALPGEQKAASMAILHSFYCWGYLAVVLLSTLFFATIGIANWRILPMLWALVPAANAVLFAKVPLKMLIDDTAAAMPLKNLFSRKLFFSASHNDALCRGCRTSDGAMGFIFR